VRWSIQVVVMQVALVAYFDLFVFELVHFTLLFRLFSVSVFWHRVIGGSSFWTGLGVCSGGSWVEGCLFDLCQNLVGQSLLIRGREQGVTQVLLGCCDVSSDRLELEWWSKLNVWSKISIGCLIDQWSLLAMLVLWGVVLRGFSILKVLVVFLWRFLVFLFSLFGVILEI